MLNATVGKTQYYGTVSSLKLNMSSVASDACKFTLVPTDTLKSEVRSQHLAGKFALIWQGKRDAASPVTNWYISAQLDCVPYDERTWARLKMSKDLVLPLGVLPDKVTCAKVTVAAPPSCSTAKAMYLTNNPDVAKAKVDPWAHYVKSGKKEGRVWPGTLCAGVSPTPLAQINVATPPALCPSSGSDIMLTVAPKPLGAMSGGSITLVTIASIVAAVLIVTGSYYAYQHYKKQTNQKLLPLT